VLTCRLYRDGRVEEESLNPARISDLLERPDTLIWVDLVDPGEDDLAMLQQEFSLPELALEDVRGRHQRASVEVYDEVFFIVMNALRLEDGRVEPQELHVFVSQRYLITLRYSPVFDLTHVSRRLAQEAERERLGGGYLLHALLDEVVDGYFDVIDKLELASEEVEEGVFADEPPPGIQERIFRLKKDVLEARRLVMPLREVLDLLEENPKVVAGPLRPYYQDVADHLMRALEFIDNLRELLTTALNAHLSLVGFRLNDIIKKLTSWAAIILVPTLIAGIYGMNFFRPFPSFGNPAGFWIAIALMVASGGVLYWVFRRRDWI
jgi:magnesium transporter